MTIRINRINTKNLKPISIRKNLLIAVLLLFILKPVN